MKVGLSGVLVVLMSASLLVGCGEGSLGAACSNMASCGQYASASGCELEMGSYVLSSPCLKSIAKASCAELAENPPSYQPVCWDYCGADGQRCAGDTVQICISGWEYIVDCDRLCLSGDSSYSGVCGDEYQGQPSDSGLDVCWCL